MHVLVVDDSALVRKFLREAIRTSPGVKRIETAPDGFVALAKIRAARPNVIVLDIDMPGMDGLTALDEIRRCDPDLPVIILSGVDRKGASYTVEALARGATDYIAKPANFGSVEETIAFVERVVVAKILTLGERDLARLGPAPPSTIPSPLASRTTPRAELVVVGVSTGGPRALEAVLAKLPATLAAPVLVVQHMPPNFTRLLAERLAELCRLPVAEAADGMVVRRGIVLAPGDFHMTVRRTAGGARLALDQGVPVNSCRPSVNVLFRSAAASYGGLTLAVVLTGMGQDGLEGARLIREAGGAVVVQDRESSVVWGMPGSVAQAGLADEILPLEMITRAIERRTLGTPPPSDPAPGPGRFTR